MSTKSTKGTLLEDIFPFMKTCEGVAEKMTESQVRQNYFAGCEAGVNAQINLELYAAYTYRSMASYFAHDDMALHGFSKFFRKSMEEEKEHAETLIKYQNMRGGHVIYEDIKKPVMGTWGTGLEAMLAALELEKKVNQALLELHKVAAANSDPQMTNFLEDHFLNEQVKSIKQLADYVTNLKRVGSGLGEYMFDKELLKD